MKYTIELTDNQKKQLDALFKIAHRDIGFTPKLEMDISLPMTESSAYTKGVEDFENLFVYEHDYEQFFENTYGTKNPDYNLYDLVAKYGAKKVLDDFKKWQEEKKKANREIKVGDEVICYCPDKQRVIITAKNDGWVTFMRKDGACYSRVEKNMEKTGRHYDEVSQLLDKLRGEENDNN